MWKGERGGGRGTFLGGGWPLVPGRDLAVAAVWLLLLLSRGAAGGLDAEDEEAT